MTTGHIQRHPRRSMRGIKNGRAAFTLTDLQPLAPRVRKAGLFEVPTSLFLDTHP